MRLLILGALLLAGPAAAQKWATSWVAPGQVLVPGATGVGRDQTARLMVRPSVWGTRARLRFSNAFGTAPLTIDGVYAGVQAGGAALVPGSNRPVTFAGKKTLTVAPGGQAWSDPVTLPATGPVAAISFHWTNEITTGDPQTFTTSYLTAPGAGALGELDDEGAFTVVTGAAPLLDAMDVQVAADIPVVLCLGDSLTAGTAATPNARDRWPDVMERRLRATGWTGVVLNAGRNPDLDEGVRLDRDVFSLSGVTHVIWLHGADELATTAAIDTVRDRMAVTLKRLRDKLPRAKILLGTLPGADAPGRSPLNTQLRTLPVDGFIPFDRADTASPSSYAGQLAMGQAVDPRLLAPFEPAAAKRAATARPAAPHPAEARPADARPTDARPADARPAASRPDGLATPAQN